MPLRKPVGNELNVIRGPEGPHGTKAMEDPVSFHIAGKWCPGTLSSCGRYFLP